MHLLFLFFPLHIVALITQCIWYNICQMVSYIYFSNAVRENWSNLYSLITKILKSIIFGIRSFFICWLKLIKLEHKFLYSSDRMNEIQQKPNSKSATIPVKYKLHECHNLAYSTTGLGPILLLKILKRTISLHFIA